MYTMASPGAELDKHWLDQSLVDHAIPDYHRPLYRRMVLAIAGEVREHVRRQQQSSH